jgi:hypothetical protein
MLKFLQKLVVISLACSDEPGKKDRTKGQANSD